MKILRRMVFREFFGIFFAALAALTGIFVLVDFFDRVQRYVGEGGAPVSLLLVYLAYKLPQVVYDITPLNLPLAALITLGLLNRRREIMAMRAAGIPVRAAMRPVFFFALLVGAALFCMGEFVLPGSNTRQEITRVRIKQFKKNRDAAVKGKKLETPGRTVSGWYRGAGGIYFLQEYRIEKKEIINFVVLEVGEDFKVTRRLEAQNARWDGDEWVGEGVVVRNFSPEGEVTVSHHKIITVNIPETAEDLERMKKDPKETGFFDLALYISALEGGGSDMRSFKVDLWAKVSYPLSGLILLVLAVPLGLKSGQGAGVAGGIVWSLLICLSYYEFFAWTLSLGRGGVIQNPLIAAWIAPVLFGIAALPIYFRSN